MSQKISPFLSVNYGWDVGESGWNTGMDENLVKFSFMFDRNIDGVVEALPTTLVNGKAYFLTTDSRLYFSVNNSWYSSAVPKWFILFDRESGQTWQFDGSSLSVIETPTDLDARVVDIEATLSALGTAAFKDEEYFASLSQLDVASAQANSYTDQLEAELSSAAGSSAVGFDPTITYPQGTVGGELQRIKGPIYPKIVYDWNGTSGTDGTPAIQQAIDSTVKVVGEVSRGAIELMGGGALAIASQVEIDQKSLLMRGNQALIKWIGTNSQAMIHVVDSSRCTFKDLVLLGDYDAPPTAAIYFEAPLPARTLGTNENHLVQGVIIGRRWLTDTTTGGSLDPTPAGRVQNGIVVGGAQDGNNDEYVFRMVQVHEADSVGFDMQNTQSIWSSFENTLANACDVGYRLGCNATMYNVTSNRNSSADIEGTRNIEVSIFGIQAEHSNVFILSKSGASFFVKGGELQMRTATPGNFFRWENGGSMVLEDLYVENIESGYKTIYYRAGSAKGGVIRIKNCTIQGGSVRDTYDIDTSGAGAMPVEIDIDHGTFKWKTTKPYADRAVTPPAVSASSSGLVSSGNAMTPFGGFYHAAYQYSLQTQHLVPAIDSANQIRARIFNVSGGAITLNPGRVRWMDLGDFVVSRGQATVDAPLLSNNTGYTATIQVPGVRLGDFVWWGAGANYMNNVVTAYVSAEDTVALRIHNATGGNSDPVSTVLHAAKLKDFGNFQGGVVYTPSAIANATTTTLTVSVPGAQLGAHTFVAYTKDLQGLLCTSYVSAADTVTVVLSNYTGASVTLASGSFKVMVAF